ncbi:MAG: hypothetical protein MJZ20_08365 [Bacteroidaceae bacterium]|nr:hypothetical protein [Bacteroidaceae bacterium]
MSERLGASFEIDVTNLKAGLTQANRLIKESKSEFKAAAAGMDDWSKSEAGLNAKIHSLTDVTEIQRKKVDALKQEYNRLIDEGLDPMSAQATNLRTKINNESAELSKNEAELAKNKAALANLATASDDAGESVDKAGEEAEKAGKKAKGSGDDAEEGGKGWEKFGEFAKAAAKAAVAAAGAATVAVAGLVKQSIEAYADYEQLVGGAQLMFGDAYDFVADKAKNAYKTVQLSQNEYLEQVNGFATGLKTSLKGDVQAAAELADKIVTAEADVVAATGNSQEAVQNAFNGIMKSNFTMLDNLQLGITPTKEGFEEVIKKVNEWNKANGKATNYQISNLADCEAALVDYIEMQGVSGYAAAEASETIQGSLSMVKGAWQNVLTGMADDGADFDGLIDGLVTSVEAFAENIIPRIKVALNGLTKLIQELAPQLIKELPGIIEELLPGVINGVVAIVDAVVGILPGLIGVLASTLKDNAPMLIGNALIIIEDLINALFDAIPEFLELGAQLLTTLADGMTESIPRFIENALELIQDFATNFAENAGLLIEAGVQLIVALAQGLAESLPILIEYVPEIITTFANVINDNAPTVLFAAVQIIGTLIKGLIQSIPTLVANIPKIIEAIVAVWSAFNWLNLGKTAITGLKNGITAMKGSIKSAGESLKNDFVGTLKSLPSKMKEIGTNLIKGLWNGIKDTKKWILDKIKSFGGMITQGLKDFFGIKSPSRLMRDEVGKFLGQGIGVGFVDSVRGVSNDVNAALAAEAAKINTDLNVNGNVSAGATAGAQGTTAGAGGVVNVYQTNNYSQAHSRYELYKNKQATAAAVRLATAGVVK